MSEFLGKSLPANHPVSVYKQENEYTRELLKTLGNTDPQNDYETIKTLVAKLSKIELHFARKENQLFPYLEKYGWFSPSQNMWAFHDQIRAELKELRGFIDTQDYNNISNSIVKVISSISHIMQVEEYRLLPNALDMLKDEDWLEMYEGDKEIGWLIDAPEPYKPYEHPSLAKRTKELPFSLEGRTHFDEGYLTPDQVNFIFKFLPVDITYVDENDRVVFYNRGDERVFPRSAGIIGREVRFCHPPKSVDQVLEILKRFKDGSKDVADFWIEFKGKFIHIRYFAVRDENRNYKGVIEMSQDVTEIRALSGQKRLLDWDD